MKYAAAIIIIIAIIGFAIVAGSFGNNQTTNFNTFRNNFNSAPRVEIFITAYNGTVLSGTAGCATAIIEEIVASKTNHRNSTTIDFNIINQTSCVRESGLGTRANYTNSTLQDCLNYINNYPTIYINYSSTANTTIIRPKYLYISGSSLFLRECGVASEIS